MSESVQLAARGRSSLFTLSGNAPSHGGHQPSELVGRSCPECTRHIVARDPQLVLPLSLLADGHCNKTFLDWNVLAELCFD
jgi:hypothetical protein